jgi:hypothetical protein
VQKKGKVGYITVRSVERETRRVSAARVKLVEMTTETGGGGVFHRWFMRRKLERFQQQQQKKVEKQIPSLPTKASWPNHIFTGRKKEKWS